MLLLVSLRHRCASASCSSTACCVLKSWPRTFFVSTATFRPKSFTFPCRSPRCVLASSSDTLTASSAAACSARASALVSKRRVCPSSVLRTPRDRSDRSFDRSATAFRTSRARLAFAVWRAATSLSRVT
ncbi:hypothetical protein BD311DRAFT_749664 [Dichomitus squalens]|uniref:REJ domain-containing protein n=1 Tax=Dichomitus squalens TaxID=114155 RepID=A0A4Q9MXF4_9APHY|nr:hypothetical protein BD311DRAFT_749664 [Dichomitus squalens]